MRQLRIVSSILVALYATLAVPGAHAQTSQDQLASPPAEQKEHKQNEQLQTVVVTGSLIPQAQVETASPVITISTQQLERAGFGTVYDALRAQPIATGAVQDAQVAGFGGFTAGANTISLLGLDPGFTLFLINGHPLADYPLLYNGVSNFVDLANIPVGMVDHIDILPGNQSSIYGSSAIAGVVNIILKDKIDGYELNVRAGGYSDGGGSNQRVEFIGGKTWGDLTATFGLQFNNQKPIYAADRDAGTTLSDPDPELRYGLREFLHYSFSLPDFAYQGYTDPGDACAGLANLFGGTTDREHRPGSGYYCGSKNQNGQYSLLNKNRTGTAYLNLKYKFNDNAELYGNVLYSVSSVGIGTGAYLWQAPGPNGLIMNANTNTLDLYQREFAPEEAGDPNLSTDRELVRSYSAWGGVRGTVGSNWDYDIFYARSQTNLTDKFYWPLTSAVNKFFEQQFLGPQLGTYYGYPIYKPNDANFYKAISPAQYATFVGLSPSKASTWTQNANIQVNNTDLFSVPAGSAGFAGVLQVGNQSWQNPADPRILNNEFYLRTGTSGGGYRNNWATAAELRVPILSTLTADGSVRYDRYGNQNVGGGDDKVTYKLGLEFRPTDALLFRGNYATAFRAPDMAYTFGGKSGFFQQGNTDYFRCAKVEPGKALGDCDYYANQDLNAIREGNAELKSITAKSFGFGGVWSPTADFDLKADYYNVKIKNEVTVQSIDQLLRDESACRLGQLDINSLTCVAALSQVTRSPATSGPNAYAIQQLTVFPINISNEHVSGILASAHYHRDLGRWGDVALAAQYNVTLKHSSERYPTDPTINLLTSPYYSTEFKNIGNASITWNIDRFSTTLYGTRFGKTPNYWAQFNTPGYATPCGHASSNYVVCSGTVAPWMLYNASLTYNITDDMKISGIVNNIKNSMPPSDSTWTAWPYYNYLSFNQYGRSYSLEFDWRFGRSQ